MYHRTVRSGWRCPRLNVTTDHTVTHCNAHYLAVKISLKTEEDLSDHVTDYNHTICESLTGMDRVRSLYALRINTNVMAHTSGIGRNRIGSGFEDSRHVLIVKSESWALKKKRKCCRLSPKQKNFVMDCLLTNWRAYWQEAYS